MTRAERRRYERNLREQQRSYKISQQIKHLRDVLQESNIPFRPNKYSILVSVADYIKQLQSRSIMLDAEHQRLIDTIRDTNTAVANNTPLEDGDNKSTVPYSVSSLSSVQGIDYESIFRHCPYPLAVATLDGRILACNQYFEKLFDCNVQQSLFVYIRNHQEIFEAMAALLKQSTATIETGEGTVSPANQLLFWCGHAQTTRNERVRFTDRDKFVSCIFCIRDLELTVIKIAFLVYSFHLPLH
jgi:PAS domain-containing protein